MNELCPICIDKEINVFTECNHGYCIGCVCRIKKCAICRNPLQRAKIYNDEINTVKLVYKNGTTEVINPVEPQPRIRRALFDHPVKRLIWDR